MSKTVFFEADGVKLEGVENVISNSRAAVIAHPHPLYGGDMHNPVVTAIADIYTEMQWTTLRFNFRGVGASQGTHDNGEAEKSDLQAAIEFLKDKGYGRVDLAGYSFGAWIIARWAQCHDSAGHGIVLVSPPAAFIDFCDIGPIAGLKSVITGEFDEIAPPEVITPLLPRWQTGVPLSMVQGADHFYGGRIEALRKVLRKAIGGDTLVSD
jgi:alpha/beta superfamily hydrolase